MVTRPQQRLFDRLCLKTRVLNQAWKALNKANPHSAGLQGQTLEEFEQGLRGNLRALAADLRKGEFAFSPVKGVPVPKGPGKHRPIRVQEVRDRIVCKAIASLIGPKVTKYLGLDHPSSFGYQRERGVRDALHAMLKLYEEHRPWVFEADIENFFGSINRDRLLDELILPALPDDSLVPLIRAALDQQVGNIDELPAHLQDLFQDAGVAQGSALSPLFANAYLVRLDTEMESRGHRMIRYADDFIVMCRDEAGAKEAEAIARDALGSLELRLQTTKTRRCPVGQGFDFLGVHFNGTRLVPQAKKQQRFRARIDELTDVRGPRAEHLLGVLSNCRQFINGWAAAFSHTDLANVAADLDAHVNKRVGIAIAKLGWRGRGSDTLTEPQRAATGVPRILEATEALRQRWPKKHDRFKAYWRA